MKSTEVDILIDQWLDKTIDATEMERLNQWIKADQANADHFAQRSHLHSRLFDWAETQESKVSEIQHHTRRTRLVLKAAAAIAALIIIGTFIVQPSPGELVATLVASPGGALRYQGDLLSANATIRTGNYELEKGISSILFENGVNVVIEAPAAFDIDSAMRITLNRGRVAANVPPEGIGFEIATPSAQIIDHGTEFAVEVNDDQSSEVHVFKGEVEVQPLAVADGDTSNLPVHLFSNAATRVEFASNIPMGIPIDNNRFLRTLTEPRHAYAPMIKQLNPALYFRLGVPKDGQTMRDVAGESDGVLIEHGASRPPFCSGKIGGAGRFNGPKDGAFVHVPDYPKADLALSGVCWIYAASLSRNAAIAKNSSRPNQGQFRWRLDNDTGCIEVRITQQDGTKIEVKESTPLPIKQWQHIAFTADGETLRLYRNGVEVGQAACGSITSPTQSDLLIGGRWKNKKGITSSAYNFWHGRIDEFALFNHALSGEEISQLYQIVN